MRRIIHNTTAIAASLVLLMPQIASAEARLTNDQAAKQAQPRAEAMPNLAAVLREELAAGLNADRLICASGDARPCDDGVRLLTPRGVAVQVARNGTIILAPKAQQVNIATDKGEMRIDPNARAAAGNPVSGKSGKPAVAAEAPAAKPRPTARDAVRQMVLGQRDEEAVVTTDVEANGVTKALRQAQEARARDEAEAAARAQAQAEAENQPRPKPRARTQPVVGDVEQAAEQATKGQTAQNDRANMDAEAALAAALAAQQQKDGKVRSDKPVVTNEQDEAQPARLQLSQRDEAQARLDNQPRLADVLRGEVRNGLTLNDLKCETGAPRPCPEGIELMTPRGIGVAVNGDGQLTLLPRARQTNMVTADGKVIPRAPEADTVETAAAKEAAEAASTPAAAALNATEGQGRVVEQEQVTQENTRSSAEDFEASLRAALEQAGQPATRQGGGNQQAAVSKDDDDNDLAKALILGLGAVAVGQMLNNNRQVALSAPDRVVVERADGSQEVIKDEVALLRQPGSTVATEEFDDGSSRTIVTRVDGSKVVTIRDANLQVLRRTLISADGKSTMLIDDTADVQPVDVASLPEPAPVQTTTGTLSEDDLRAALQREANIDRRFTLGQIRNIPEVRALVAPVNIDAITFNTGSAAINPDQARQLASLGRVIQDAITRNPQEVFMVEGYTDTVGSGAMNLALSDRRAESVALALSEYFDVPPENLVVQGYGEQFLKVRVEGDIRENRRASVRRITELLQTAQAN